MQQFKISESGIREIKKKLIIRQSASIGLVIVMMLLINYFKTKEFDNEVNGIFFVLPLMVIFFVYRTYVNLKKAEKILSSFKLTVTDTDITREQLNLTPLSISKIEINAIEKYKSGRFVIKGLTATDEIHVPQQIDRNFELEQLLSAMQPVNLNEKEPLIRQIRWVIMVGMILALLGIFASHNIIIMAVSGVTLLVFFGWVLFKVQTSKNVDQRTKKRLWIFVVFLLVVIFNAIRSLLKYNENLINS